MTNYRRILVLMAASVMAACAADTDTGSDDAQSPGIGREQIVGAADNGSEWLT